MRRLRSSSSEADIDELPAVHTDEPADDLLEELDPEEEPEEGDVALIESMQHRRSSASPYFLHLLAKANMKCRADTNCMVQFITNALKRLAHLHRVVATYRRAAAQHSRRAAYYRRVAALNRHRAAAIKKSGSANSSRQAAAYRRKAFHYKRYANQMLHKAAMEHRAAVRYKASAARYQRLSQQRRG